MCVLDLAVIAWPDETRALSDILRLSGSICGRERSFEFVFNYKSLCLFRFLIDENKYIK